MTEITSSRHNPLIDPSLHIWGWQIPVYLFLGGLVAGLMILSGYHIVRAQWDKDQTHGHYITAPLLSILLLSVGMLALFLDLEHRLYVWRLYTRFQITSPMSWGSWILLLVYPALIGSALIGLPKTFGGLSQRFPFLNSASQAILGLPALQNTIGFVNIALGILLGIYTGILLSALGARPLWNSSLLGPLFLFSGLSTGAATLHILSHLAHEDEPEDFGDAILSTLVHWVRPKDERGQGSEKLVHADNSFLTVEIAILMLFLIGMLSSTEAHQHAAALLLTGPYAAGFWVFVVGIGILLPLTLQLLQTQNRIRPTLVPALLVISGSLALRIVFVYAGQYSHWLQAMN